MNPFCNQSVEVMLKEIGLPPINFHDADTDNTVRATIAPTLVLNLSVERGKGPWEHDRWCAYIENRHVIDDSQKVYSKDARAAVVEVCGLYHAELRRVETVAGNAKRHLSQFAKNDPVPF